MSRNTWRFSLGLRFRYKIICMTWKNKYLSDYYGQKFNQIPRYYNKCKSSEWFVFTVCHRQIKMCCVKTITFLKWQITLKSYVNLTKPFKILYGRMKQKHMIFSISFTTNSCIMSLGFKLITKNFKKDWNNSKSCTIA